MKRILSTVLAVSIAAATVSASSAGHIAALNAAFSGKLWIVAGAFALLAAIALSDWTLSAARTEPMPGRPRRRPARINSEPPTASARASGPSPEAPRCVPARRRRRAARVPSTKIHPAVICR